MNDFLETMQIMVESGRVDSFVFRRDIHSGGLVIMINGPIRSGYSPPLKYSAKSFHDAASNYHRYVANCETDDSQFATYLANIGILK